MSDDVEERCDETELLEGGGDPRELLLVRDGARKVFKDGDHVEIGRRGDADTDGMTR